MCWGYKPTLVSPGRIVGELGQDEEKHRHRTTVNIMEALKPATLKKTRGKDTIEERLYTVCFMDVFQEFSTLTGEWSYVYLAEKRRVELKTRREAIPNKSIASLTGRFVGGVFIAETPRTSSYLATCGAGIRFLLQPKLQKHPVIYLQCRDQVLYMCICLLPCVRASWSIRVWARGIGRVCCARAPTWTGHGRRPAVGDHATEARPVLLCCWRAFGGVARVTSQAPSQSQLEVSSSPCPCTCRQGT